MTICLYPNLDQTERLDHFLFAGRVAYNRALEASIFWYKTSGKHLSLYDHFRDLTPLRDASEFWSDVPVQVQRDALRRLDKGFKAFFRRLKEPGSKPGFPRFKGRNRWNSFTIQECGKVIRKCRIRVSGVTGTIRCRNLREVVGDIKEQRIVRRAGKWYCQLVIDDGQSPPPPRPIRTCVGIDVGLTHFAVLSDGQKIANPRFGKTLERKLDHAHRCVSRKVKGSHNRRKSVGRLQAVYASIADARSNFTHQVSRKIVNTYDLIAVEDLNVKAMSKGHFAKSILDACWAMFTFQLCYKAESAGCTFVKVDPRNTTQECSQCSQVVPKELSVRVHVCPHCGLVLGRDHNAALNILRRGIKSQHPAAVGGSVMPVEEWVATPVKQEVLI